MYFVVLLIWMACTCNVIPAMIFTFENEWNKLYVVNIQNDEKSGIFEIYALWLHTISYELYSISLKKKQIKTGFIKYSSSLSNDHPSTYLACVNSLWKSLCCSFPRAPSILHGFNVLQLGLLNEPAIQKSHWISL